MSRYAGRSATVGATRRGSSLERVLVGGEIDIQEHGRDIHRHRIHWSPRDFSYPPGFSGALSQHDRASPGWSLVTVEFSTEMMALMARHSWY
jgi:hypothetical protein